MPRPVQLSVENTDLHTGLLHVFFFVLLQGEDVALALELQCRGHVSCYLHECLAVGEVPTSIRAICMQKSR